MDPRSENLNTEVGLVIESPKLAGQILESLEDELKPENSWHVQLDDTPHKPMINFCIAVDQDIAKGNNVPVIGNLARSIRRQNIELPGGTLRSDSQEVLLRGKNKRVTGEEIAELPLVSTSQS